MDSKLQCQWILNYFNYAYNSKQMLSKLCLLGPQYRKILALQFPYPFSMARMPSYNQITDEHIQKSTNIKQLIGNVDLYKLTEQPAFRNFMRKLTELLVNDRLEDPESVSCIERLLYELRRFSSAEIHSTSSDLLNYQLLFKQLTHRLPSTYTPKGFEVRASLASESIPINMSFEDSEATAVALLHYMSTFSMNSKSEMKKNTLGYILRYCMNQKDSQGTKNSVGFDVNTFAIIVSCIGERNMIPIESSIYSLSVFNLNRKMPTVKNFLNCTEMIRVYFEFIQKKEKFDLSSEELIKIKKMLSSNYYLEKFSDMKNDDGTPKLVINSQERFLQTVDILIKLIKNDYNSVVRNEINYKGVDELMKYFYAVLFISKGMKIWVSTEYDLHEKWYKNSQSKKNISPSQKKEVKQITLLKILAEILQNMEMNRIYYNRVKEFYALATHKVLQFIKESLKPGSPDGEAIEKKDYRYKQALVKLISLLPISAMEKQYAKDPKVHKEINKFLKKMVKQLPENETQSKLLVTTLIRMAKLKNTLFMSKKDWIAIFDTVVKQDKSIVFWDLYFFLGSTNDPEMIDLIPFPHMISKISSERAELEKVKKYIPPFDYLKVGDISDNQSFNARQTIDDQILCRNWQILLLRLHALILLTNKEQKFSALLQKHSNDYKVHEQEIETLFSLWLNTYRQMMLHSVENTSIPNKQFESRLSMREIHDKPICYFGKYFHEIFIATSCYYQFKLIKKIITHSKYEFYMSKTQVNSDRNFMSFFFVLIFGLADPKNAKHYLSKYPASKVMPQSLRGATIFKCSFIGLAEEFLMPEQWDYLLKLFAKYSYVHRCKDFYLGYKCHQELYKQASILGYEGLAINFNKNCQYSDWKGLGRYQREFYETISKKIFKQMLLELLNPEKRFMMFSPIAQIVNFLQQLCYLNHQKFQLEPNRFIEPSDIQRINQWLLSLKGKWGVELSSTVYKMRILGLLNDKVALHLLKSLHFYKDIMLTRIICLAAIGKERALAEKIVTEEQWQALSNQIYKISSQIKVSVMWLLVVIQFASPEKFEKLLSLVPKIYHPIDKKMVAEALKGMQIRHNIKDYEIKLESSQVEQEEENEDELVEDLTELFQSTAKVQKSQEAFEVQQNGNVKGSEEPISKKKIAWTHKTKTDQHDSPQTKTKSPSPSTKGILGKIKAKSK